MYVYVYIHIKLDMIHQIYTYMCAKENISNNEINAYILGSDDSGLGEKSGFSPSPESSEEGGSLTW